VVIRYNEKYEKVRLLCVHTPEFVHPDKKQNIPMGKVASKYTQKKLAGKYVCIFCGHMTNIVHQEKRFYGYLRLLQ
jgi:endonuclease YncB( thermonuclease family)